MIKEQIADEKALEMANQLYPDDWSGRHRFLAGMGQLIGTIYDSKRPGSHQRN